MLLLLLVRISVVAASVGVIGGGLAGLAAVAELRRLNIDCVLLEASNRLGGRVFSIDVPIGTIQMGAEFINGEKNEMYRIANALGILSRKEEDYGLFAGVAEYGLGNTKFSRSQIEEWEDFIVPLEELFIKRSKLQPALSVSQAIQEQYSAWLKAHPTYDSNVYDALLTIYKSYYESEWSAPVEELALANFDEWDDESNTDSAWILKGKGFKDILDVLIARTSGADIRLNSTVTKIDYSNSTTVKVDLSNGTNLIFDQVIVTIPLGYLKRHSELFKPQLPAWKREIIRDLGFGSLQKVFLVYEKRWWSHENMSILTGRTQYQRRKEEIFQWIRAFQTIDEHENVLLLWLSGQGPKEAITLTDRALGDVITDHLREMLQNTSVPSPSAVYTHNWDGDELYCGAYSYITPASYNSSDDSYKVMAAPIYRNRRPMVCFAGEHTHQTLYQTTSGAFESGRREARRLASLYKTIM